MPVYRNEPAELNRVNLVFLLVDLDTAELALGIRLDAEIDCPSATPALFLSFCLICAEFYLAVVLIAAVRTFHGLPDDHDPSSYSSSGSACKPPPGAYACNR